tara:strand:- start:49126 stop:49458 length:333 start_codon:yes stop_codon:yes gene_type:complete
MEKVENMTKFDKQLFTWDGMYLMYRGDFEGSKTMDEVHPNCHPSWVGKVKPSFIARFKYGAKPYKSYINCITENYTVEEYLKVSTEKSPLEAVQAVGYSGRGRYYSRSAA